MSAGTAEQVAEAENAVTVANDAKFSGASVWFSGETRDGNEAACSSGRGNVASATTGASAGGRRAPSEGTGDGATVFSVVGGADAGADSEEIGGGGGCGGAGCGGSGTDGGDEDKVEGWDDRAASCI